MKQRLKHIREIFGIFIIKPNLTRSQPYTIYSKQHQFMVNSRVIMPVSNEVQALLDQFTRFEGAGQICNDVIQRRDALRTAVERGHPLGGSIARKIFALFAYEFQRAKSDLLLTPRVTINLYSQTTGKPKETTDNGLDMLIMGVSTPDGVQMKIDEDKGIRRVRKLHKYQATPELTAGQVAIMQALANRNHLLHNLGITNGDGQARAGRTLGNLLGNGDAKPLILGANHEVVYTVPSNSALLGAELPERVVVESLPMTSVMLRDLTTIVVTEVAGNRLNIPTGTRVLR